MGIVLTGLVIADITTDCSDVVALYHFDGDATDSSNNGNDGIINGATYNPSGKVGGAYEFDGVDDYVDVGNDEVLNFNSDFTISAWFKTSTSATTGVHVIAGRANGNFALSGGERGYYLLVRDIAGDDYLYFDVGGELDEGVILYEYGLLGGIWHHLMGVRNGDLYTLYMDGVSIGTDTASVGNMSALGQSFRIGRSSLSAESYFNGTIDEVII